MTLSLLYCCSSPEPWASGVVGGLRALPGSAMKHMRQAIAWVSAVLGMLGMAPAAAETIVERSIEVTILADGSLRESTHLLVRIENQDDASSWSTYRLFLDANRQVESLDVRVRVPDGGVRIVGEDEHEEVARRVGGVLYGSQRDLLVHVAPLEPGELLDIRHTVAFAPYFPASRINVRGLGSIEKLHVRVNGAGEHWRWRLEGPTAGLAIEEHADGIVISGRALARIDLPPLALDEAAGAVLRFAWGPATEWRDIGAWYRELNRDLPAPSPAVSETAREVVAGATTRRQKLDRLIRFLEQKIRYVAVSVGEGNVRPSPADETLERQWGDCKDKTLLLIEMLRAVDIEAFPALVRFDADGRIDRAFPSPVEFNHVIAALPARPEPESIEAGASGDTTLGVQVAASDPVAGGLLFVDTTQQRAAGHWLAPGLQGQDALVVDDSGGRLVETPILVDQERRSLEAELRVAPNGDAHGDLVLSLSGEPAYKALGWLQRLSAVEADAEAAGLLASLLPGAKLEAVRIRAAEGTVPAVTVLATIGLPSMLPRLDTGRPSFQLPGMRAAPSPGDLADEHVGRALPATTVASRWTLALPPGYACTSLTGDVQVDVPVGRFEQRVAADRDGRLVVAREAMLRQRFVPASELADLRTVALAEHRAHRRRLRLACDPPADSAP